MLIFSTSFPKLTKFPYFMNTTDWRVLGGTRPKDRVTLQIILVYTLTLDLHAIYTAIDTYMHNAGSNRCCESMWFVVLNQLMV
jgi:hypothetical protein